MLIKKVALEVKLLKVFFSASLRSVDGRRVLQGVK